MRPPVESVTEPSRPPPTSELWARVIDAATKTAMIVRCKAALIQRSHLVASAVRTRSACEIVLTPNSPITPVLSLAKLATLRPHGYRDARFSGLIREAGVLTSNN